MPAYGRGPEGERWPSPKRSTVTHRNRPQSHSSLGGRLRNTIWLGSVSSPLCRTLGRREGGPGTQSHLPSEDSSGQGSSNMAAHSGHLENLEQMSMPRPHPRLDNRNLGVEVGGPGVSSFKKISTLAFVRPGGNRKTSFPGEHKEVSGLWTSQHSKPGHRASPCPSPVGVSVSGGVCPQLTAWNPMQTSHRWWPVVTNFAHPCRRGNSEDGPKRQLWGEAAWCCRGVWAPTQSLAPCHGVRLSP